MSKRVTEPEILVAGQAMEVPLDMIRVDENLNLRRYGARPQEIKALAESIKANGIINALTVRALTEEEKATGGDTGQQYMLVTGFQRVKALLELQGEGMAIPHVPVSLRNGNSNPLHLNLAENRDRNDLSPLDEASALKTLVDAGETIKDAVKHFGKSPTWGSLRLKYLDLRPVIQKKVHDGTIGTKVADTMTGLDETEQDALLEDLESGGGSARSKVEQARSKKKKKGNAGRKTEKGGTISGKQAVSQLEKLTKDLKTNYTLDAKDKVAIEVLGDVQKFLSGKLGAQGLFKAVAKAV